MDITVTAKIKLDCTSEQENMFDAQMSAYRSACNFLSEFVFESHILNREALQDKFYHTLRDNFGLKSQMAISVIRTVVAKYKSDQSSGRKWTLVRFKKPQCDLVRGRDYTVFPEKGVFSVNTLEGRVKVPFFSKGMENYFDKTIYKLGTARLVKKHGKYFLHIPATFEVPDVKDSDICLIVGGDLGLNFSVVVYDSNGKTRFVRGGEIKCIRMHESKLRAELQACNTPSARQKLRAIAHRENRRINDINHCISKTLVESYPEHTLFVFEDLHGIRKATVKFRRKDRYVAVSWPYYDLLQKVIYKAAKRGSKVITVDPKYTSQMCPVCGHVERANRNRKTHTFCCKACGYRSNDDRIAAMNLYRKGKSYLKDSKVPNTEASQQD